MVEEERSANSVSRRTMLKRIGIAGAVAWVTPVISSLTTPAYAASSSPCAHGFTCNGEVLFCDGVGSDCFCSSTADGTACTHGANSLCEQFDPCPEGRCGSGTVCVINSCCPEPVCLPLCGTGNFAHTNAPQGGLTPTG